MDQNPYQMPLPGDGSSAPLPAFTASASAEIQKLEGELKNQAGWMYWIAGTTVVNTFVILFEGNFNFLLGLFPTMFLSGMAIGMREELGQNAFLGAALVAVAFTFVAAGIFIALGYFGAKRHTWAFIVAFILYLIDTLLYGALAAFAQGGAGQGEILSIIMHGLALVFLFNGMNTSRKLNQLMAQQSQTVQPY
ncbi:MAG: hypothetical protein ACO1RA_10970 [Planctomycetaceae bacterium]